MLNSLLSLIHVCRFNYNAVISDVLKAISCPKLTLIDALKYMLARGDKDLCPDTYKWEDPLTEPGQLDLEIALTHLGISEPTATCKEESGM